MPNLWFDGYVSFESSQTAGHFIRLHGNELTLGRYDGSRIFKEECSFKMTRRDSSCGKKSFLIEIFLNLPCIDSTLGISFMIMPN